MKKIFFVLFLSFQIANCEPVQQQKRYSIERKTNDQPQIRRGIALERKKPISRGGEGLNKRHFKGPIGHRR